MARTSVFGLLAALVATALWGFTFLGPAAVHPVNVYALVVGRYAVFGVLSCVVLLVKRSELARLGGVGFCKAMHLGVVGYIGFYLLLSLSASIGGGVLASTLTGLIPALVSVASNLLTRTISWGTLLGPLVITSAGLVLVNTGSGLDLGGADGSTLLTGTVLAVLACILWSYFVVANGVIVKQFDGGVDNTVWTASIGVGAFGASLLLIPLAVTDGGGSPFADAGATTYFLGWCIALAVLGSWGATWFWNIATRHLSTTMLGPIIGMEAVFGAGFNLLWQGRGPSFSEFWGGMLVIGGVFVSAYLFHRARARASAPSAPGRRLMGDSSSS